VGIEEGAKFKGSIEMDQAAVEKALGKVNIQGAGKPAGDRSPGRADARVGQKDAVKETPPGLNPPAGVR
jgi:hypothetical protein